MEIFISPYTDATRDNTYNNITWSCDHVMYYHPILTLPEGRHDITIY